MERGYAGGRNADMSPKAFRGNRVINKNYKEVIFKKRGIVNLANDIPHIPSSFYLGAHSCRKIFFAAKASKRL